MECFMEMVNSHLVNLNIMKVSLKKMSSMVTESYFIKIKFIKANSKMERKKVMEFLNGKTKINKNTNMKVRGYKTIKRVKENYLKVIFYNMKVHGKMEKKMVMVFLDGEKEEIVEIEEKLNVNL